MSDRFYMQKCAFAGITPSELVYTERFPQSDEALSLNNKILKKLGLSKGTTGGKRMLKAEALKMLVSTIGVKSYSGEGLDKLTVSDILELNAALENPYGMVTKPSPKTGLKKVYVAYLKENISQDVDFNKATLDSLKKLIEALGV